jgi:5-methylcytosine-specific restriction endonuclease McrA
MYDKAYRNRIKNKRRNINKRNRLGIEFNRYRDIRRKFRRVNLKEKYAGCNVCKIWKEKKELEIDHIIPVSQGGSMERHNLQIICHGCHIMKTKEDRFRYPQENSISY